MQYIIIMIGILEKRKQTIAILGIIIINHGMTVVVLLSNIVTEIKLKQVIASVLTAKKLSKMLLVNNRA